LAADVEILRPGDLGERDLISEAELARVERRLERLAMTLDSAWSLPGTRFRFGADSLIGLIPGVGDMVTLGLSGYLVMEARRLGAPPAMLRRMAINVGLDAAIGAVPVLGDAFDVVFKANRRNMALLRDHLADLRSRQPKIVGSHSPGKRI
jgi:hypothetical protein